MLAPTSPTSSQFSLSVGFAAPTRKQETEGFDTDRRLLET